MTPSVEELLGTVSDVLEEHIRTTTDERLRHNLTQCRIAVAAVADQFDGAVADRLTLLAQYDQLLVRASKELSSTSLVEPTSSIDEDQLGESLRPSHLDCVLDERRSDAASIVLDFMIDAPPIVTELRELLRKDVAAQAVVAPTW